VRLPAELRVRRVIGTGSGRTPTYGARLSGTAWSCNGLVISRGSYSDQYSVTD